MIYTSFIYGLVYIFTCFFAQRAKAHKIRKEDSLYHLFIFLSVFSFSIIIGTRYDVGIDYHAYYDLVNGLDTFELERVELFPHYLALFVQSTKLPFYFWFIIMAGISIYFIEKVFRNEMVILLPFAVLLYLLYYLDFNVNVVRQACAASLILFGYSFIYKKQPLYFCLVVCAAFLFHRTALISLPLYWLVNDNCFLNRGWQFVVFVMSALLGTFVINKIIEETSSIWIVLGYYEQLDNIIDKEMLAETNSGYGVIFNFFRYSIFILLYKKVCSFYKSKGFNVFYKIFFIGICLYYSTKVDVMLSRMNMYFLISDVAVSAYIYYYMIKVDKRYLVPALFLLTAQLVMAIQAQIIAGDSWQFVKF